MTLRRLFLLLVLVQGCGGTSYTLAPGSQSSLIEINEAARNHWVTVIFADGTSQRGKGLRAQSDFLFFAELDGVSNQRLLTCDVAALEIAQGHNPGVTVGMGILFSGVLISSRANRAGSLGEGIARLYGGGLIAVVGIITAFVSGSAGKKPVRYVLPPCRIIG